MSAFAFRARESPGGSENNFEHWPNQSVEHVVRVYGQRRKECKRKGFWHALGRVPIIDPSGAGVSYRLTW